MDAEKTKGNFADENNTHAGNYLEMCLCSISLKVLKCFIHCYKNMFLYYRSKHVQSCSSGTRGRRWYVKKHKLQVNTALMEVISHFLGRIVRAGSITQRQEPVPDTSCSKSTIFEDHVAPNVEKDDATISKIVHLEQESEASELVNKRQKLIEENNGKPAIKNVNNMKLIGISFQT
jgi:hypothetical protein